MSDLSILVELKTALETLPELVQGDTIQLSADALKGDQSLQTSPSPRTLPGNTILWFPGGVPAVLTTEAPAGSTTLSIDPLKEDLLSGDQATVGGAVVIEEWGELDSSRDRAPFIICQIAQEFSWERQGGIPTRRYQIPIHLLVKWDDWDLGMIELAHFRGKVIRALDQFSYPTRVDWKLVSVLADDEIYGRPDPFTPKEMLDEALPVFLGQVLTLVVEEYPV